MDKHKMTYDELLEALRKDGTDLANQAADKIEQLQRAYIRCFDRTPRRAHWIDYPLRLGYEGAYSEDHIVCSNCHAVYSIMDNDTDRFDYCPTCGAIMRNDHVVVRRDSEKGKAEEIVNRLVDRLKAQLLKGEQE